MSLVLPSQKGQSLTCSEYESNILYSLDLANATGQLDCAKINQLSLATCLLANSVIIQLQQDISDNSTAIGEVAQDLTESQTTLQTSINNLITLINNQNATIADLTTQVATLTSGFNSLSSTVDSFNSRLLSVEGRLTTLEDAIASGIVVIWVGLVSNIPAGWQLMDGTNGTPDIRNRFIIAAGSTYAINSVGGNTTHSHSLTGTTGGTSLTGAQLAPHNHFTTISGHRHDLLVWWEGFNGAPGDDGRGDALNRNNSALAGEDNARGGTYRSTNGNGTPLVADAPPLGGLSSTVGSGDPHDHSFSATTTTTSNIPPYYALAYIMRV